MSSVKQLRIDLENGKEYLKDLQFKVVEAKQDLDCIKYLIDIKLKNKRNKRKN